MSSTKRVKTGGDASTSKRIKVDVPAVSPAEAEAADAADDTMLTDGAAMLDASEKEHALAETARLATAALAPAAVAAEPIVVASAEPILPIAAPVAAVRAPTTKPCDREPVQIDVEIEISLGAYQAPVNSYVKRFDEAYEKASAIMRTGAPVLVTSPDLACVLWSSVMDRNVHCHSLRYPNGINIVKTQQKKTDNTGKRVNTDKSFINLYTRNTQSFDRALEESGELNMRGYKQMTYFGVPTWLNHGSTEKTGVNGTSGKTINGQIVAPGTENYQFGISTERWSREVSDEFFFNPLARQMMDWWTDTATTVLGNMFKNDKMLLDMRSTIKKKCKDSGKAQAQWPVEPAELAEFVIKNSDCNFKVKGTDQASELQFGTSVYRTPRAAYQQRPAENISTYVPPSQMFIDQRYKKNPLVPSETPKEQVHFDLPCFRCRRADEVKPGVAYKSPFIRIAPDNAEFGETDVVMVLYSLNAYEYLMFKCGFTNKQVALVWLNKKDLLMQMSSADATPCDPRYAVPMAGYYHGPKGWEGGAPPAPVEQAE